MADQAHTYVLSEDDIDSIAEHVSIADPRNTHIPNGSVATLIGMLREVQQNFTELSNGMTVAVELLDRFVAGDPCTEGDDICRAHGYARKPCPTALAQQVVTAWRAVQAEGADRA
jgi:hypothetical protein